MAWDLWGSSYDQEHPEWQCDFFFGCGPDVIEENALNEEYCIQVLRILITKADTEIEELEKDLLSLQNELAWTEHEKWPEICCSALTERINWLDVAISTLKKDHADEVETRLLLHYKPAETLNEIVKALQRGHYQDRYGQLLDGNISNPIMNVSEFAPDKESSDIDSNIVIKEEGKEICGTSDLQLELQEKRPDDAEKELLPNPKAFVRSPNLGDISCSPGHSDGMKLSGTSDDGDTGNEEVRRCQLIARDTGQILNMLSAKENGTREAKSEIAIVKENHVSLDALILASGIKGRKKCIDSSFGASHQRKGRNSDFERKLSEFALKAAQRACKKEPKVAPVEDLGSMNCPLQVVFPQDLSPADTELCSFKGGNGTNSPQATNIQNTSLMHGENSALISLLEMQAKNALYTGLQLTDEEKPLTQGLKPKIGTSLAKSNMSFPSKLKTRGKRKSEFENFSTGEPLDSPTAVITNTPLIVSTKRQRKSTTGSGDASSNETMKNKMTKRAVQPGLYETEVHAIVPYDSEFSELQKRRVVSKLPTTMEINSNVEVDVLNPNRISTDDGSLASSLSENTSGSLLEVLKKCSMANLKTIAKENSVKKYHKLSKGALIELLVEQLGKRRTNNLF